MEDNNKKYKSFGLTNLSLENSTSVLLIMGMIFLLGFLAYTSMPKEQFPEASLPTAYVNTPYFGNSAEEIENLITRPLEKQLENIAGIKDVTSNSIQDFSVIVAQFEADQDNEVVIRKVKDAVEKAKMDLPDDLKEDPSVLEINFSEIPIMTINISGDYSNDELKKYAELVQDRVENVKQVSKVDLKGSLNREVKIDVDLFKMQSLQVSFGDIQNAISSENITMSGGELINDDFRRNVRIVGQFDDVKQIENLIVKSENQRPIFLKDIAQVEYGYKARESYSRADGKPVISLDVIKRKGQNLLEAADIIKQEVEEARQDLPDNLTVSFFNDQSVNTKNEVANLENSIIFGVILVVLVLLFFLGLRNASFVGLAIPLSMLLGILILNTMGITLNIVVLFALILALGMLVDNAIVAVENIYRYMQNGYSPLQAAKYGVGEIAVPIIASTATTLAAFLPLGFWPGIMGEFMKYFPITLIIVLCSSLFVALVITPVLTNRYMKITERVTDPELKKVKLRRILKLSLLMLLIGLFGHIISQGWLRNLMLISIVISLLNYFFLIPASFVFQERFLPWLEKKYDGFINFSLKYPFRMIFANLGFFVLSLILFAITKPEVTFFPDADPIYINAFVELPMGADIEATNKITLDIEKRLDSLLKDKRHVVEAVLTQIGENTSDPNSPPEPGVTPHKARITVSFVKFDERGDISSKDIMDEIRNEVKGYPGVEVSIDQNANGPPAGKPINLEIRGDDIKTLLTLSEDVKKHLEALGIPGIEELKSDIKLGKPELLININREAARRYELSTYSIANTIRTAIFGQEVSKYKEGEDEYPIMVRLDEMSRNDINTLMNQKITFRNPANGQIVQVPISSVADIEYSSSYNAIKRKNSSRVLTLYSNVLSGYNANAIVEQLKDGMNNYSLPDGFSWEFTGEQQQQAEDMGFLTSAFMIAVFLIFLILVSQFNSLSIPLIVIASVGFSLIGVFLGYSLTGTTISVIFSGVGIISLAGVVVNNAIVLLDYIMLEKKRLVEEQGLAHMDYLSRNDVFDIIVKAGSVRLRPVLLTAITTVLGLIPLAVGMNVNFFSFIARWDAEFFIGGDNTAIWGPMAWTVIYGLVFATFLTLIVVPVMYWLRYRLKMRVKYGKSRYNPAEFLK